MEWLNNEKECHWRLMHICYERMRCLKDELGDCLEELQYLEKKMSVEEYKEMAEKMEKEE